MQRTSIAGVSLEGVEPSCPLQAAGFKPAVYTIPPQRHIRFGRLASAAEKYSNSQLVFASTSY